MLTPFWEVEGLVLDGSIVGMYFLSMFGIKLKDWVQKVKTVMNYILYVVKNFKELKSTVSRA